MNNQNYLKIFKKSINWMENCIVPEKGIIVNSEEKICYPEVSGYYISTLIDWGYRKEAIQFAKWLISIQKDDGSWYDCHDMKPYVFDSAQILKGLLSVRKIYPNVDKAIINGCDWILSNMQEDGRLKTPSNDAWGDDSFCSELVHIYCISPILEAAEVFNNKDYYVKSKKILAYYINNFNSRIKQFNMLSHFYAYVIEGLVDVGEIELAKQAMEGIACIQNSKGMIPGLNDIKWTCSTGLFQFALIWYKLGDLYHGNKTFEYACSLQNKTGGWYGSYPTSLFQLFYRDRRKPYYFPKAEISWAVKYYLDALTWKSRVEFEKVSNIFTDQIDEDDGRLKCLEKIIKDQTCNNTLNILDIGCGKGRYLLKLLKLQPNNNYYAVDISSNVMENLPDEIFKNQGTLTNIPHESEFFDIVIVCESLEHSIHCTNALKEIMRVIKKSGKAVIIDKNYVANEVKHWKIGQYEQWFTDDVFLSFAKDNNYHITIEKSIPYENEADNLFNAWIISK